MKITNRGILEIGNRTQYNIETPQMRESPVLGDNLTEIISLVQGLITNSRYY